MGNSTIDLAFSGSSEGMPQDRIAALGFLVRRCRRKGSALSLGYGRIGTAAGIAIPPAPLRAGSLLIHPVEQVLQPPETIGPERGVEAHPVEQRAQPLRLGPVV